MLTEANFDAESLQSFTFGFEILGSDFEPEMVEWTPYAVSREGGSIGRPWHKDDLLRWTRSLLADLEEDRTPQVRG